MSYIKHVLQPDEKIVVIGRLHWIIYWPAFLSLLVGIIFLLVEYRYLPPEHYDSYARWVLIGTAAVFAGPAVLLAIHAWFIRWTTEIAVTNKRIIYKQGFITRHTVEMNMDKVASVDVDQGIFGRIFDYGSVRIIGTGGAVGIEQLDRIGSPVALRNAIDAR